MKRVGSLMAKGDTEKLAARTATTVAATGESVLPASLIRAARQERPFEEREMVVRVHVHAPICDGSSEVERPANNRRTKLTDDARPERQEGCKPTVTRNQTEAVEEGAVDNIHEVGGSIPSRRPISKIKPFQFRWREPLGKPECPYAHRTLLNLGLFSIRVHEWHRSDDKRFMHDHPWHFVTLVLRGSYTDVSSQGRDVLTAGSVRYRHAGHAHYVEVPPAGAVTIILTSYVVRNWGFWVKGKFVRPLRFFGKFGHPPCSDQ